MEENAIKITLDDVLGPDGIEGAWDAMVRGLVERAESRFLHSEAGQSFHAVAVAAINEAVKKRVKEHIEELMANPIQPTDGYGHPKGEPTSFNEMIGEAIRDIAQRKLDSHGRRDSFGKTILGHAIDDVAGHELRRQVAEEVKKIKASAKLAITKKIAEAVADQIK